MPDNSTNQSLVIPPPTGGWNTRDSIVGMDPQYALDCENFLSNGATVDLRNGYRKVETTSMEYLTNGTFDSTTTGWTASNATLTSVAGGYSGNCLSVANSGANNGYAYQAFTAVSGNTYGIVCFFKKGTAASGRINVGSTIGGSEYYTSGAISDAGWTQYLNYFVATGTTIYVSLKTGSSVAGETALFDSVSIQGTNKYAITSAFEFAKQDGTTTGIYVDNAGAAFASSVSIGSIPGSGGICSACMFKNKLFIASPTGTHVYKWDGSTLAVSGFTGPAGGDAGIFNPMPYKSRLWFPQYQTLKAWYGDINGETGTMTSWDFQYNFTRGGVLLFVGPVAKTGNANTEYLAAISSRGEIVIFQGDTPDFPSWGIVGRYFVAPPMGVKAFFYYGQNLLIITRQGLLNLSDYMGRSAEDDTAYMTDIISTGFADAMNSVGVTGQTDLASGVYYPAGNYILLNCPYLSTDGLGYTTIAAVQLVYHTIAKAWAKFTGQAAASFTVLGQNLNFGGASGKVFRADYGEFDENQTDAGTGTALTRTIKLRSAYNYFGKPSQIKQFVAAKPIITETQGHDLTLDVNVDYTDITATSRQQDLTTLSSKTYMPIMGLNGIGKAGSIRIDGTVTTKSMSLKAIEVFWNDGGKI